MLFFPFPEHMQWYFFIYHAKVFQFLNWFIFIMHPTASPLKWCQPAATGSKKRSAGHICKILCVSLTCTIFSSGGVYRKSLLKLVSPYFCFLKWCFFPFLTSFKLFLNQLFHTFLFFHTSVLLPSGSTNPWPLQTGSMRVRGQPSVVIPMFSFTASLYLHLPLSLPWWKTFNPKVSSHQLQSTYSSTLDTTLPHASSSPPPMLSHLVLSVKMPLPVSCARTI